MSLILFIVRKWSDKAILITSIIFLLQPIEWYHYVMSLFNPGYTLPDLNVGAMYDEVAAYTKGGNFWEFLTGNVTLGQKAYRISSEILDKGTYHSSHLFCPTLFSERTNHAK